jgi:hypothetical protein
MISTMPLFVLPQTRVRQTVYVAIPAHTTGIITGRIITGRLFVIIAIMFFA